MVQMYIKRLNNTENIGLTEARKAYSCFFSFFNNKLCCNEL